ncbi:uncharacterized protein F5Z01DRAFT_303302 [Emericellopsis atlantica]|uniref:Dihydroneopterin aldolase/epimerase domain-containing protein n=1 Tax=Emericellopsis atlantica TaxID=2614577 RepID=A0A9P8CSH0_9HYPO|nr:uncharacterized protein F5Z01DRAFT_303302 [Emericellopsis atlantica]KAG9257818.1 hypothetical protein F5Z01DRAFT_303302 [Emericellopsis atlantica]
MEGLCPLVTSWQTRHAAGEPVSTITLKNLTTTSFTGPSDAWGRASRPQPVTLSAEVSLSRPFTASAGGDTVQEGDTVHYGLLSKELSKRLLEHEGKSLGAVLQALCEGITGRGLLEASSAGVVSYLKPTTVRLFKLEILLPKGTLLGSGVSLTGTVAYPAGDAIRSVTLKFHDLRVPTLIGVNSNEREAEQMVVANVAIEKWTEIQDGYHTIERLITKTMKDSSFETLEALAAKLSVELTQYLTKTYTTPGKEGWRLIIALEKPVAVPLADCPCVELSIDTADVVSG